MTADRLLRGLRRGRSCFDRAVLSIPLRELRDRMYEVLRRAEHGERLGEPQARLAGGIHQATIFDRERL